MRKRPVLFVFIAFGASLALFSCKKEKAGCEGGNLCFTLNGSDISVPAVRRSLPNDNTRLFWEEGADSNYKSITIDVFGTGTGEYSITDNAGTAGDAAFQYLVVEQGISKHSQGITGKFNLSSVENDTWSGTFSGTVSDGTASYELKDGKFFDVPKE